MTWFKGGMVFFTASLIFISMCSKLPSPSSSPVKLDVNVTLHWQSSKPQIASGDTASFTFGGPAATYHYRLDYEDSWNTFTLDTANDSITIQYSNIPAGNRDFYLYAQVPGSKSEVYQYSFTVYASDIFEPDDSKDHAVQMSPSSLAQSHTLSPGDVDWYWFKATEGTTYIIRTTGSVNASLSLLDTNSASSLVSAQGALSGNEYSTTLVWACKKSGSYYFNVSGVDFNTVDGSYEISMSSLSVTVPLAGDSLIKGIGYTVQWVDIGAILGGVSIALFDTATCVYVMTSAATNSGRYAWNVPTGISGDSNYSVRVASSSDSSIRAFSNKFSIVDPPKVSVTSPAYNVGWAIGSADTIRWNSVGNVGSTVSIALYNNGSFVQTISSSVSNTGSFVWTVPSSVSTGSYYTIKVSSTSSSSVYAYSSYFSIAATPAITVNSPYAGASWTQGSSYTILWTSSGSAGSYVSIGLYSSGSLVQTIASSASNSGSYTWTVPTTLTSGSAYTVKVASTTSASVYGYSPSFTITTLPTITVNAPTSAVSWTLGSSNTIQWTSIGNVGTYVSIALYNGSALVSTITPSASNTGSYSWTVPTTLTTGSTYNIKVTSTSNMSVYAYSPNFTIASLPTIIVTSPTSSSSWITGSSYAIQWTSSGSVGSYVSIALYNGSSLVQTISTSASNGGSYSWTVPTTLATAATYNIKIASTSNSSVYAYSGNFTIATTPTIIVTAPTASLSWNTGSTYAIQWTSSGSAGSYVSIALYSGGSLVSTIASSAANSGIYSWTVPTSLAATSAYSVKITSTADASIYGYSGTFSIVAAAGGDSYESDNSYSTAKSIATDGSSQSHTIYPAGDVDWCSFAATSGVTYTIQTTGSTDMFLRLYSTNGTTLITSDDDGAGNGNALISWTCPANGTYYFQASGFITSTTGSYGVSVTSSGLGASITKTASSAVREAAMARDMANITRKK